MKAIANFAVRRRWLVVIGWIVLIIALLSCALGWWPLASWMTG